ncbi:Uncharacterized protein dnm_080190 [Desulfonema magnum]|uniref:Uncharacterized protein n=1 Tax=Desulfonema magnum TaxID=45655 RepID=A0A975GSD3_9BACT|nr:Uncharacterized protein dnm_080190 [Desulfonema magnum]
MQRFRELWIPAFAGMTKKFDYRGTRPEEFPAGHIPAYWLQREAGVGLWLMPRFRELRIPAFTGMTKKFDYRVTPIFYRENTF